jgi:hypothetical protein
MSKKIILLALAAASMAGFALPATAMAVEEDVPLHVVPKPEGPKTTDGVGNATLTGSFGTVTCTASSGKATFESTTTGTFEQTFTGCTLNGTGGTGPCTTEGLASGTITTTELPFHLLTVEHTPANGTKGPGVLITPNKTTGVFAHFICLGFIKFTVEGNGLIGTITKIKHNGGGGTRPPCEETQFTEGNEATIEFSSSSTGVQTHKTVVGTSTEYSLSQAGAPASEDAEGTITLGNTAKLECT